MCDIPANPGGDAAVYCKCRADHAAEVALLTADLKQRIESQLQGSVSVEKLRAVYSILRHDGLFFH